MLFWQNYSSKSCCLCGSKNRLTGEHKIKSSVLREQFGDVGLYIGSPDSQSDAKFAQGLKSRHLKFLSRLCELCNSARTQPPDRAFERYNNEAQRLHQQGQHPSHANKLAGFAEGNPFYLDVFRYFAKLLSCQLADADLPRPRRLSQFAIGLSNHNPVWLATEEDSSYLDNASVHGSHKGAAHGGLVVYGDTEKRCANAFHSTLTVGPIQYVFFIRLAGIERLEFQLLFPSAHKWCQAQIDLYAGNPLDRQKMRKLGLSS